MTRLIRIALASLLVTGLVACEEKKPPAPVKHKVELPPVVATKVPHPVRLKVAPTHALALTPPERLPECHELFEVNAEPRETLESTGRAELFETLVGCGAEAWTWDAHGNLYAAYATTPIGPETPVTDLRLATWDKAGNRRWSVVLERRDQGQNFQANFRDSFVTLLGERFACAGTRWEGGTTAACAEQEGGKLIWSGRMAFWGGIVPTGLGDVFYVADLGTLSRRYPFSGVEMRSTKLDGSGGRSAFYGTDGEHLFFSPARADEPRLVRYDFETMKPAWRVGLPAVPTISYGHVFGEQEIVVLKFGNGALTAFSTEDGRALWSYDVGEDRPSMAAGGGLVYLLHRVPDVENPLYAIDAATGEIRWQAPVPSGTLHVFADGDRVILKSVRAISVVESVEKAGE